MPISAIGASAADAAAIRSLPGPGRQREQGQCGRLRDRLRRVSNDDLAARACGRGVAFRTTTATTTWKSTRAGPPAALARPACTVTTASVNNATPSASSTGPGRPAAAAASVTHVHSTGATRAAWIADPGHYRTACPPRVIRKSATAPGYRISSAPPKFQIVFPPAVP